MIHRHAVLAVLLLTTLARAQTNIDLMIKPFAAKTPIEVNGSAYALTSGHTDNASADYQLTVLDLSARYRFMPNERFDPRLGLAGTFLNFNTDDRALPDSLFDGSIAVGFGVYEDQSGWQAGVTLGAGYAGASGGGPSGDDLFADSNAWYGKASILLGKRISKTDRLLFVLDYDGNRTYKPDCPFPGFAYQKLIFGNPDPVADGQPPAAFQPQLLLTFGVPYAALHWEPVDHLSLDVSYLLPDNFAARIDYSLIPENKVGIYLSADSRRNAFHWDNLRHGDDRIIFYQRRAELGLRWTPAPRVNLLAAAGYAFAQELTTGFDSDNDRKLARLGDRPYFRIGLEIGF